MQAVSIVPDTQAIETDPDSTYIRMPSYEQIVNDPVLYAHADRIFHRETNPGNARPLVQSQGRNDIWVNPPPIPLETEELDWVFEQPYKRVPHPTYGQAKIPAYEMIRFSVNIMREAALVAVPFVQLLSMKDELFRVVLSNQFSMKWKIFVI